MEDLVRTVTARDDLAQWQILARGGQFRAAHLIHHHRSTKNFELSCVNRVGRRSASDGLGSRNNRVLPDDFTAIDV